MVRKAVTGGTRLPAKGRPTLWSQGEARKDSPGMSEGPQPRQYFDFRPVAVHFCCPTHGTLFRQPLDMNAAQNCWYLQAAS